MNPSREDMVLVFFLWICGLFSNGNCCTYGITYRSRVTYCCFVDELLLPVKVGDIKNIGRCLT